MVVVMWINVNVDATRRARVRVPWINLNVNVRTRWLTRLSRNHDNVVIITWLAGLLGCRNLLHNFSLTSRQHDTQQQSANYNYNLLHENTSCKTPQHYILIKPSNLRQNPLEFLTK
jgi:hypothetical protein